MKWYRLLFGVAAVYNLSFGIWAGLFPLSFFHLFELADPRYPSIWACVGMVVGLYAVAYAYAAWRPEQADVLIAIGLAGKLLGPVGWLRAVWVDELPARTFPLILANDLVWWFPFAFYLLRRVRERRAIIVGIAVALHVVACVALLAVRHGTELSPNLADRLHWILQRPALWTAAWLAWAGASMSLLALLVVWSERLSELGASRAVLTASLAVCAIGVAADLFGETVNIVRLTRADQSVAEFARGARLYALAGPVTANGLYCIAGLALSRAAWRVGMMRGALGLLGFVMWLVGLGLTVVSVLDYQRGMVISGGLVMALFVPWAGALGWRLRRTSNWSGY